MSSEALLPTRRLALGSAALVDGFALIGFEIHPDATAQQLETVLQDLVQSGEQALVFVESGLASCDCAVLERIRTELVRIVVVEIPPLNAPQDYHPPLEQLVRSVLGPSALE